MLLAGAGGPPNEPVRVHRIGCYFDFVKSEIDIGAFRSRLDILAHLLGTFFAITLLHFGCQIGPLHRRIRVKLIWPPH